jgi:hypothetical protein
MMLRRMLEGAPKWALRDLRLDEEMSAGDLLILTSFESRVEWLSVLTNADLGHCD